MIIDPNNITNCKPAGGGGNIRLATEQLIIIIIIIIIIRDYINSLSHQTVLGAREG